MDTFNRIFIIGLLLVWAFIWAAIAAIAFLFPLEAITAVRNFLAVMEGNATLYIRVMVGLLGVIFVIISLLLLVVELTPSEPKAVQLDQVSGGVAWLTTDAVVQRVKYDAEQLPFVLAAKPRVTPRGRSVDILVELTLGADSEPTASTQEAYRIIREAVETKMGVKLGRLQARVHQEVPRKGTSRPTTEISSVKQANIAVPPADTTPQPTTPPNPAPTEERK
ncbi:MAG: hypothetical protein HYU86_12135 [Chloroflexi bacterium]|nr:hypothetical protein [Chloroflexota bacterium]